MLRKLLIVLFTAFLNAAYINYIEEIPSGESGLYIYGKIYTDNDGVYTGQIRWGDEESFWFDHFNSSKPENEYIDYLSKSERRALSDDGDNVLSGFIRIGRNNSWSNSHTHQFACQFGHIKAIEIGRGDNVELELKDGTKIDLEGGSNDIETDVQINDVEIGHITIDWDDIERVEFMSAPASLNSYFGSPLYGTAELESGEQFTGFIQWDHDERLANDILNGETEDGDMEIKFGNIGKIEKARRGSDVTTKSGRTMHLRGTNDVNDDNRGIIVNIPGSGRIDIPWDEFESVTFTEFSSIDISYDDFKGHDGISGTVITEGGDKHTGKIVYDLDETYLFEILNGEHDDIEYSIPFQSIQTIKPISRKRTEVTLHDGTTVKLENSVDVSDDNDGILIFEGNNDDPVYVPWEDVSEIKI